MMYNHRQMETREHIPHVLLPQVKRDTIDDLRRARLETDPESFVKTGIPTEDPLRNFLSNLPNPLTSLGGQEVYILLAREAQKMGKELQRPSSEYIQEYSMDTPIFTRDPRNLNRVETEDTITFIEKKNINSLLERFHAENPLLMNNIKHTYESYQLGQSNRPNPTMNLTKTDKIIGYIYTYELLHNYAENQWMKRLGID